MFLGVSTRFYFQPESKTEICKEFTRLERNCWPFVSLTRISELNWVTLPTKLENQSQIISVSFWSNFRASCKHMILILLQFRLAFKLLLSYTMPEKAAPYLRCLNELWFADYVICPRISPF
jgi:hypothetical protein